MSSSVTLEVTYIKIENNGKTALELDKLNGVFVVNGKGYYVGYPFALC